MPPQEKTPDEPVQAPVDGAGDQPPATAPFRIQGWRPQHPPQLPYELLEKVWANLLKQEKVELHERMRQQARLDFQHQLRQTGRPRLTPDERIAETRAVRRTRFPVYAAVGRWWQEYFEQQTFSALTVTQEVGSGRGRGHDHDRGGDVETLYWAIARDGGRNRRRLGYIKVLRLHIAIAAYGCPDCKTPEPASVIRRNNKAFSRALWIVLLTLSWGDSPTNYGINFELSAASPSDGVHWYKDFELGPEYPYRSIHDVREELIAEAEDPEGRSTRLWPYRHGQGLEDAGDFYHRVLTRSPPEGSARRLMGTKPLTLVLDDLTDADLALYVSATGDSGRALWAAPTVTSFSLRRQFRRLFNADTIQRLVATCLPSLLSVQLELWEPTNARQARAMYDAYAKMLAEDLPPSVMTLCLTYDDLKNEQTYPADEKAMDNLAEAVIEASKKMRNLSSMCLVDATLFFKPDMKALRRRWVNPNMQYTPPPIWWDRLQTLSMTAPLLDPLASDHLARWFLLSVGAAISRMPRLLALELWNERPHSFFGMIRLIRPALASVRIPRAGGGANMIDMHGDTGNEGGILSTLDHGWQEVGYRPRPATLHMEATWPMTWLSDIRDLVSWVEAVHKQDTMAMRPWPVRLREVTVVRHHVNLEAFRCPLQRLLMPHLILHPLSLRQYAWEKGLRYE